MQPEHAQNSAQLQSRVKNSFGNTVESVATRLQGLQTAVATAQRLHMHLRATQCC